VLFKTYGWLLVKTFRIGMHGEQENLCVDLNAGGWFL
jgi:hypothetical protein